MKDEFKYSKGENASSDSAPEEYSNKTLQKMRKDNFTLQEIKKFKVGADVIGSDTYSQTNGLFNGNALAYTTRPSFWTGASTIHYAQAAFASKELLFTTMVHETGHSYIMYAGNFFVKKYDQIELFNRGFDTPINDLGHAAIWDLENHLKKINNFTAKGIGYNHDVIMNTINNNISGNNTTGFNILKNFLFPVFNRKIGIISPF